MPLIKARSSSIMDSVDLRGQPTAETASQTVNTNQLASTSYVRTAIADLVDASPDLLNTLAELAAAINNDEAFSVSVANSIATKLPKDGSEAMTGPLTLSGAPTQNLHAVTKLYVDDLVDSQMIYSTDDVAEGQTNLYYTEARVKNAISLDSDNTVVLDYDSTSGQFTYRHPTSDGVLEGQTNRYFTQARARQSISLNSDDAQILGYSDQTGVFTFTTPDTDKIVEGQTNLYFTTARARQSVSGGANIDYDNSTGIISTQAAVWTVNGQEHDVVLDTDDISEGSANLYFTDTRAANAIKLTTDDTNILSYNTGTGRFTFVTPSTDAIDEGTNNLYYTDARVRAAVSASGDISYNDATGNFSYSTPTTDGVNEGSTNKYFTEARARNSVSLNSDNTDVLSYDNTTGLFTFSLGNQTTDDVAEGSLNLYFTTARARNSIDVDGWSNLSYNNSTGVISISAPSTSDVTEGSNLYFTTQRARDSVSATDAGGDGSFSYDSATGAFTYTGPSASETRAHFAVTDTGGDGSLSYDDATGVFTYTGPDDSEIRAHFSATTNTGAQYNSTTGVFSLSGIPNSSLTNNDVTINGTTVALGGSASFGTDSVTEEGNLYFLNSRARSAISLTTNKASVLDYNSTTGEFTFDLGNQTTDDIAEGVSNLYFTTQRARDSVSAIDAGGDGSFSYDDATGAFTYTGPSDAEVRAHISGNGNQGVDYDPADGVIGLSNVPNSSLANSKVTVNGYDISLGGSKTLNADDIAEAAGGTNKYYTEARFDASLAGKTTDDVAEGSNLYYTQSRFDTAFAAKDTSDLAEDPSATATSGTQYFTQSRARNTLSGGTGVTYTAATGEIAIGQDVSTTSDVTFNDVTVSGDLTVLGTLTSIQSNTVEINDLNLTLAKGAASGAQANGAGLTIDGANATLTYVSGDDRWETNKGLYVNGDFGTSGSAEFASIDNTPIGATTPSTGKFTALTDTALTDMRVIFAGTGGVLTDDSRLSWHSGFGQLTTYQLIATSAAEFRDNVAVNQLTTGRVTFAGANHVLTDSSSLTFDSATGTLSATAFTGDLTGDVTGDVTGNVTGQVSDISNHTTTDLAEGTNLYYTTARVLSELSATSATGVTYDSATGVFSLASVPNSSLTNSSVTVNGSTVSLGGSTSFGTDSVTEEGNLYFTNGRARSAITLTSDKTSVLNYNSTTGEFTFNLGNQTTDDVSEGSNNLYFTEPRVWAAMDVANTGSGYGTLSYDSATGVYSFAKVTASEIRSELSASDLGGDGSFSYDSATGVFSYTGPSASETRAHFSATSNTGITYDSATGVFALASVPNSSLTNSSVTINGTTVSLGATGSFGTDSVTEESNLYFTDGRARDAISLTTSDTGVFSYDPVTGEFVYDNTGMNTDEVTEGQTNLYFTQARARQSISATGWSNLSYDDTTGVINISAPSTSDVTEGTNLYFLNSRARSAISLTTDNTDALSYDTTTGEFTFTLNSVDTDEIAEGATNKYFTTARARNTINNGANIDYDASTGTISTQAAVWSVNGQTHDVVLGTDDIDEGSTNLYFLDSRARSAITLTSDDTDILAYNSGTGVLTFTTPTTDAIEEGLVNLYYTDGRADDRIAAASIRDLRDVNKTEALQDGYTLVWSSALGEFVPQNIAVTATTLNFTGDGTTLSFSTGVNVTSIDNTQVYINGLIQAPTYSYTISTTSEVTSIVFDTAPEANDYIFVRVSSTSTLTAGGVLNESSNIDGGTY